MSDAESAAADQQLSFSHFGGRAAALEAAAKSAHEAANDRFAAGEDGAGRIWMSVSDWLAAKGRQARDDQREFA